MKLLGDYFLTFISISVKTIIKLNGQELTVSYHVKPVKLSPGLVMYHNFSFGVYVRDPSSNAKILKVEHVVVVY